MRSKIVALIFMTLLALPSGVMARPKIGDWWKPGTWFSKKARSTTVIGMVDSVAGKNVSFKTLDGQMLNLIGDHAAKVAEHRSVKIRVFGNVFKPDQKYPAGALQVRSFKVLEEAPIVVAVTEPEPEPYVEPEPYMEPVAEPAPVASTEDYDDEDDDVHVADLNLDHDDEDEYTKPAKKGAKGSVSGGKTYVVASGDTLGKISSKVYGTSGKWKKIADHNGITNPKLLKVGMTLRIP